MDRPGIIGSRANNQLGGAGVSWDPQLVAIRVFDDRQPTESDPETCELADAGQLVAGLHWAIGRGVGVINLSMSMPGPPPEALAQVAMEAFTNNVVLVAAAGNNGNSIKRYPAALRRTEVFGTTSPTP